MNFAKKSQLVSFLLTLFLGPIGLFYSTIAGALGMILVCIVSASTVIGPFICWGLSILIGAYYVGTHNYNVEMLEYNLSQKK